MKSNNYYFVLTLLNLVKNFTELSNLNFRVSFKKILLIFNPKIFTFKRFSSNILDVPYFVLQKTLFSHAKF